MSDFLDDLEGELVHAARRRSALQPSSVGRLQRRWVALLADLRAVGSGAMMVASVGVVVVVMAVVVVSGRQSASLPRRESVGSVASRSGAGGPCGPGAGARATAVSDAAPRRDVRQLLGTDAPTTAAVQHVAVGELDLTVSQAIVVYARYIRTVWVPGSGRVILIPARTCHEGGRSSGAEPVLLAEVRSHDGVATIRLGTPSQIHAGDAFRTMAVSVQSGHGPQFVAMVPTNVLSVVCRHVGSGTGAHRFAVVNHLVVMPQPAAGTNCDLIRA